MIDQTTLAASIKLALDKAEKDPTPMAKENLANDLALAISVFAAKLRVELAYPGNVLTIQGNVPTPAFGLNTFVPTSFIASTSVV